MLKEERLINKYVYALFILIIGLFLFFGVKQFFSAFLGTIVFYILFKKMMSYLVFKKKWKKGLAALLIILISFFIVIVPVGALVLMIVSKLQGVLKDPATLDHYIKMLDKQLKNLPFDLTMDDTVAKVQEYASSHAGEFLNSTMNILASLLMMYFMLYFLLINVKIIEAKILYYLPFERDRIEVFGTELQQQTFSNAIGVPAVACVQGLAAYVIYLITGAPDAGLLATLTAFSSIIPLVGTAIIWLPLGIFQLANGETWQGITVLAYCALVLGNLDNVVRMFVSKKVGDVHPLTTVLGVILGLKYFGLPGLVFGPLLISYFFIMLRMFHEEYKENKVVDLDGEAENLSEERDENLVNMLLDKLLDLSKVKTLMKKNTPKP